MRRQQTRTSVRPVAATTLVAALVVVDQGAEGGAHQVATTGGAGHLQLSTLVSRMSRGCATKCVAFCTSASSVCQATQCPHCLLHHHHHHLHPPLQPPLPLPTRQLQLQLQLQHSLTQW